jgi:HK97 family phage major capsid protein
MPTYSDIVDRGDASPLIPEEASREILGSAAEQSSVLSLARRLPDMARNQRRLPVWSSLPHAYFVDGDTGLKQTTDARWRNVYVNAEELAVIVVIPDNVLDDVDYDLWSEMRPGIVEAFGLAVDQAILYGINAPALWPEGVVEVAEQAGHVLELGTNGDLYDDILGEGGILSFVEEDGYMVSGHIASLSMRAKMRGLRDQDGQPVFRAGRQATEGGRSTYELDGEPVQFPKNGAIDPTRSLLISGDWSQLVYAIRKDITYSVHTDGVLTDADGNVLLNLMQQDSTALRCVFRLGWALPNPVNRVNEDDETRYPFAVLEPANAS